MGISGHPPWSSDGGLNYLRMFSDGADKEEGGGTRFSLSTARYCGPMGSGPSSKVRAIRLSVPFYRAVLLMSRPRGKIGWYQP